MAALVPPAAGTIQRTSVDLGSIPGLLERLDPALVCQRCIAAKLRGDGRSLEASRPVVLTRGSGGSEASRQLSIGGASASVGTSRCHAAVRVGAAAAQDDVLVSFEVRRGCLTPDDKWARRVERLLDDCYASNLALDRARLEVAEGIFWKLSIVVTCESDDGAASDCCLLAASAALAASTLPAADIKDGHVALVPNGADPTAAASPATRSGSARRGLVSTPSRAGRCRAGRRSLRANSSTP